MDEAKAAQILAEFFPTALIRDWDSPHPRRDLYVWEQDAIDWLREWRKRDSTTPINAWTSNYIQFGSPPWRAK